MRIGSTVSKIKTFGKNLIAGGLALSATTFVSPLLSHSADVSGVITNPDGTKTMITVRDPAQGRNRQEVDFRGNPLPYQLPNGQWVCEDGYRRGNGFQTKYVCVPDRTVSEAAAHANGSDGCNL